MKNPWTHALDLAPGWFHSPTSLHEALVYFLQSGSDTVVGSDKKTADIALDNASGVLPPTAVREVRRALEGGETGEAARGGGGGPGAGKKAAGQEEQSRRGPSSPPADASSACVAATSSASVPSSTDKTVEWLPHAVAKNLPSS